MNVIGVCRFSFVGRGDWKAYQGVDKAEEQRVALEQAEKLFEPERMEARFQSFEHLTLASLRAQTDQNFKFIVLASELMPEVYRKRLEKLCSDVPQVTLRYHPNIRVHVAQQNTFDEMGLDFNDTIQFRLDDDDCVCVDFIETVKWHLAPLMDRDLIFVASLRGVMFAVTGGEADGVYHWPVEFLGAGTLMRHPSRSIYAFGHHSMAKRFTSIVIPDKLALVTHSGVNDTTVTPHVIKWRKMVLLSETDLEDACAKHFPFLSRRGKETSNLIPRKRAERN